MYLHAPLYLNHEGYINVKKAVEVGNKDLQLGLYMIVTADSEGMRRLDAKCVIFYVRE